MNLDVFEVNLSSVPQVFGYLTREQKMWAKRLGIHLYPEKTHNLKPWMAKQDLIDIYLEANSNVLDQL